MKKIFLVIFIFSAFSCQDMMTDEVSTNSPIVDTETKNITDALNQLKKDSELAKRMSLSQSELERQVEITKQMFLILYNLRSEMPESLRGSKDWIETMRNDPAAAEFGNKLKAKLDELPPELSICDAWEWTMKVANCFWVGGERCIYNPVECLSYVENFLSCMELPCSPF